MITGKQLRELWLNFYKEKGHVDIGSASLIPENDTSVLFTTAGMHPLVPYLLGNPHPSGSKRLCNIQKCVRTGDIDEVGDNCHLTFFEMMGNWSLGDYFKKEKTAWTYEFLTKHVGLDPNKIEVTVFKGDESAPRDTVTEGYLRELGFPTERIHFNSKEDNWWGLGTDDTPCGPDNEWFYPAPNGTLVELNNDVYMEYVGYDNYTKFKQKDFKCVDTGFGIERALTFFNKAASVYGTEIFEGAIKKLEKLSGKKYNDFPEDEWTKSFRIVADHTRAAMAILGDDKAIVPSNTGAGYVLRRLIRKSIRHIRRLGISEPGKLSEVALIYVDYFKDVYPEFKRNEKSIADELNKEEEKFLKTLESGEREFNKLIERLKKFAPDNKTISGKEAFRLFDTFGFPLEFTMELAKEVGYSVDESGFNLAFEKHQELARTANAGVFKGGLTAIDEMTTKLHTATHIMLAGLRKMFGNNVFQKGSNITPERLRFDFNLDRKMTDEEIKELEAFVNDVIKREIPVVCEEMSYEEAQQAGALGVFTSKYGEKVKVYTIGDVSKELCGGPHATNTKDLVHFTIQKEESSSSGVRRIKAILS